MMIGTMRGVLRRRKMRGVPRRRKMRGVPRRARHYRNARADAAALIIVIFLLQGAVAPAQGVTIDPVIDWIILGSGVGIAGLSELLLRTAPPVLVLPPPDIDTVDFLDRAVMVPYSRQADTVSSIAQYTAVFLPLLQSVTSEPGSTLSNGIAYAESLAIAYGAKNIIKHLFPRYRPYAYLGGAQGVDPSEDDQSFPSGHSTIAFTAAAFSAYLFFQGLPGTANYLPFVIANFSLAGITASYRVISGMHFLTDVMAGAVLGTFCGFIVPSLIRKP